MNSVKRKVVIKAVYNDLKNYAINQGCRKSLTDRETIYPIKSTQLRGELQMTIGVAVIGTGMVANVHVSALKEIASADLRGVWGRNEASAQAFASRHGVACYRHYEEVLTDPSVDVVINCLPPGNHAEYSIAAAAAKKHVVVEKPIEISVERANALINACRSNGVKLAVIFQKPLYTCCWHGQTSD